ncbi:hypothetical protein ALC62_13683 [Cyphomyrmex costatus]|uniref:Uncharacterized protein n=1 Tax=Cyphomyrmex costatus TaxID=456900 RepID=A0A151I9D6_9HYME|nr:hypothetical protein ALC62_13683 [Cyphomyrmex costatus]
MELILLWARCVLIARHGSDNIVEETSISCLDICQKCGEEGIEETDLQMESSDEREFVSPLIRTYQNVRQEPCEVKIDGSESDRKIFPRFGGYRAEVISNEGRRIEPVGRIRRSVTALNRTNPESRVCNTGNAVILAGNPRVRTTHEI